MLAGVVLQYFSGKEDVFRHLAGQVARQLGASIEALDPLTPDTAGWAGTWAWLGRYADIYGRYEPVFQTFQAAAESDEAVAGGSARTAERHVAGLRSRLATTTLPPRQLDPVITLLLELLPRTLADIGILRVAVPDAYPDVRVQDALADVMHRTLVGFRADVNAHPPAGRRPPVLEFGPVMRDALQEDDEAPELNAAGRRTLGALLESGRDAFVTRGYYRTRVDDVVAAAGVSHGAFYRYFESRDQLAHVLAVRAIRTVSTAFADIPAAAHEGSAGRPALRRYNTSQATEAAMIRVWVDATRQNPRCAPTPPPRSTGAGGAWRRSCGRGASATSTPRPSSWWRCSAPSAPASGPALVDAAVHAIEGGFLGR